MEEKKSFPPQAGGAGAVVIFFILLFLFAKWGPSIPFSVLSLSRGEPMVVTGEGKIAVVPDIAKVSAGIEEQGQTPKQVQDSANKKSQSLVAALKKLGIEDKDIKTSSYNIYPQSDYQANPPNITGYRVSVDYQITVRKIDNINTIMTAVTANGANLVSGVSFDLSDEAKSKALDEARIDAVKAAKENAQSLARASGITLGKVINVTESQNGGPRPIFMADKAVGLGGETPVSEPDIQPGQTEINITVSLSYEVR